MTHAVIIAFHLFASAEPLGVNTQRTEVFFCHSKPFKLFFGMVFHAKILLHPSFPNFFCFTYTFSIETAHGPMLQSFVFGVFICKYIGCYGNHSKWRGGWKQKVRQKNGSAHIPIEGITVNAVGQSYPSERHLVAIALREGQRFINSQSCKLYRTVMSCMFSNFTISQNRIQLNTRIWILWIMWIHCLLSCIMGYGLALWLTYDKSACQPYCSFKEKMRYFPFPLYLSFIFPASHYGNHHIFWVIRGQTKNIAELILLLEFIHRVCWCIELILLKKYYLFFGHCVTL